MSSSQQLAPGGEKWSAQSKRCFLSVKLLCERLTRRFFLGVRIMRVVAVLVKSECEGTHVDSTTCHTLDFLFPDIFSLICPWSGWIYTLTLKRFI